MSRQTAHWVTLASVEAIGLISVKFIVSRAHPASPKGTSDRRLIGTTVRHRISHTRAYGSVISKAELLKERAPIMPHILVCSSSEDHFVARFEGHVNRLVVQFVYESNMNGWR